MVTDNMFGHKCVFSEIIPFYLKLKINALRLLARGREGEAFSRTITVYVLMSCWA